MPIVTSTFLSNLNEDELFQYMRNYFPDLINLNEENEFAPIDWYVPSIDLYIEAKCRNRDFPTLYMQKDKWEEMRKVKSCWYVNSTPSGVYGYQIDKMEEPVFFEKFMEKSQLYSGKGEYVRKEVAELKISNAHFNLDQLIFV